MQTPLCSKVWMGTQPEDAVPGPGSVKACRLAATSHRRLHFLCSCGPGGFLQPDIGHGLLAVAATPLKEGEHPLVPDQRRA